MLQELLPKPAGLCECVLVCAQSKKPQQQPKSLAQQDRVRIVVPKECVWLPAPRAAVQKDVAYNDADNISVTRWAYNDVAYNEWTLNRLPSQGAPAEEGALYYSTATLCVTAVVYLAPCLCEFVIASIHEMAGVLY